MPIIQVTGPAAVYEGDPNDRNLVSDTEVLIGLTGFYSEEGCAEYFDDDEEVESLELYGGCLRFFFDETDNSFKVHAVFGVKEEPTDEQLEYILEETSQQFSDGIGTGAFGFLDEHVLSAQLLMAIMNENPDALETPPRYSVDANPESDVELTIEYSPEGDPQDDYLNDLEKGSADGDPEATLHLALLYQDPDFSRHNIQTSLAYLKEAMAAGHEFASVQIADIYLNHADFGRDVERAVEVLREGIAQGSTFAKTKLGVMLVEGEYLPTDHAEGLRLMQEAADEGNPVAKAELGDGFEFGIGVDVDLEKARQFYQAAYDDGFEMVEIAIQRVEDQLSLKGGIFATVDEMLTSQFGTSVADLDAEEGVVMIQDDDPELAAAVRRVQASIPKFIQSLQSPTEGAEYSLKVKVEADGHVEFMWLNELQYATGKFIGKINNDPMWIESYKIGDEYKSHVNDVNDWLIVNEDGTMEGGYTIELMARRQQESE